MKEKIDFKGVKDLCDRIGLDCQVIENGVIITDKRDIWEGVEFAVKPTGTIGKIEKSETDLLHFIGGFSHFKEVCKPSNEKSYVEQKKKEAFEKYGEIKEGDRFEFASGGEYIAYLRANKEWDYIKSVDQFFYYNVEIYRSGKWATKLPKRIEVELIHENLSVNPTYQFKLKNFNLTNKADSSGSFLASQLEKYLNREIE